MSCGLIPACDVVTAGHWRYLIASVYEWGGHAYAAFGINVHTYMAGVSRGRKGPRTLRVYQGHGDRWQDYAEITWHDRGDQFNGYSLICPDPLDPDVMYVGRRGKNGTASPAVLRSTDAGKTWHSLTLGQPLDGVVVDGARETECIRVHPVTREAWAATSYYGVWKIAPPQAPQP